MDRGTSSAQTPAPGDFTTEPGPGPQPCSGTPTEAGPVLNLGSAFVKTIRHVMAMGLDVLATPDIRWILSSKKIYLVSCFRCVAGNVIHSLRDCT